RRAPRAVRGVGMIVLSGADLVLPDRVLGGGTLVLDGDRIVDSRPGSDGSDASPHLHFPFAEHYIVPGFIDVHVHGVEGLDTLGLPPDGGSHDGAASSIAGMGRTWLCRRVCACRRGSRAVSSLRSCRRRSPAIRSRCAACCRTCAPRERSARPPARACCQRTSRATSSIPTTRAPSPLNACAGSDPGQTRV